MRPRSASRSGTRARTWRWRPPSAASSWLPTLLPGIRRQGGVRESLSLWGEAWDDSRFDAGEVMEAGDNIVVIGGETGREGGTEKGIAHGVSAVGPVRNGRAVRYRLYADRDAAV